MLNSFLKFTQLESSRAGIQVEDSDRRTARAKASVKSLVSQETKSVWCELSAGSQGE